MLWGKCGLNYTKYPVLFYLFVCFMVRNTKELVYFKQNIYQDISDKLTVFSILLWKSAASWPSWGGITLTQERGEVDNIHLHAFFL